MHLISHLFSIFFYEWTLWSSLNSVWMIFKFNKSSINDVIKEKITVFIFSIFAFATFNDKPLVATFFIDSTKKNNTPTVWVGGNMANCIDNDRVVRYFMIHLENFFCLPFENQFNFLFYRTGNWINFELLSIEHATLGLRTIECLNQMQNHES